MPCPGSKVCLVKQLSFFGLAKLMQKTIVFALILGSKELGKVF